MRENLNLLKKRIMRFKKFAMKVSAVLATVSVTFSVLAGKVVASPSWLPDEGTFDGTMSQLIRTLLNTAVIMAAVVAVAYLVYNGFKYMMSAGDTAKTEEAQKGIANALIGLVICLAAAVVIRFVMGRLDVEQNELESRSTDSVVAVA
jgi:lysylphosphatidylglycerol synthetase-like protein (DUF2156 family)